MLDELFIKSNALIKLNNQKFKRYFIKNTDLSHRLNIILGSRGIGKTTTLAQLANKNKNSLYLSLDDIEISTNMTDIIKAFVINGGRNLYLDEIHKNKEISSILKFAYDNFKELNIVATGSSALEILKSSHDLSRRAIVYKMHGMSFREYLAMSYKINLNSLKLEDVLENHYEIALSIVENLNEKELFVIKLFKEYLKLGYYPYFKELNNELLFYKTLKQSIEATIDSDLLSIYPNLTGNSTRKLKLLLHSIAKSVPFIPNYTHLKNAVEVSDDRTLKEYLFMLENAGLIRLLMRDETSVKNLDKAEKIYLENTNLMQIFIPNSGNLRETFFANQLGNVGDIYFSKSGDFRVLDYIFEVGGAKKSFNQIKNLKNSFVISDDLEIGFGSKIPLWLFGFLY